MVKSISTSILIALIVVSASSVTTASAFAPRLATKSAVQKVNNNKVVPKVANTITKATKSTQLKLSSSAASASGKESSSVAKSSFGETLQIGTYFALWYLFNIAYNIYNKKSLNVLAYPWTIAALQMAAGLFYFVPLWILGIRKAPKLSFNDYKTLLPIALCHTGVHVGAVVALGAGAVSFAHIVKASEPVVTCGLNALLLGQILPVSVYATLLPIIAGVAVASMNELSFTWLALASAMLSNVSSAARGVLSKKTMSGKKIGENLDAQNLYAVLTAISTIILIPTFLAMEGTSFFTAFAAEASNKASAWTAGKLAWILSMSGITYYAYNEVAFLALGKVNPVTHAVGNTIKRVVIIVASVVAFKTPLTQGSVIGSSVAIFGTLLYSLAMNAAKSK